MHYIGVNFAVFYASFKIGRVDNNINKKANFEAAHFCGRLKNIFNFINYQKIIIYFFDAKKNLKNHYLLIENYLQ